MPEHGPFRHQIVSEFTWHKVKSVPWSGVVAVKSVKSVDL